MAETRGSWTDMVPGVGSALKGRRVRYTKGKGKKQVLGKSKKPNYGKRQ